MEEKHLAFLLTALILACLLLCGVIIPVVQFLLAGLWPYRAPVSLALLTLFILVIISGQARRSLKSIMEVVTGLPDLLDGWADFLHGWRQRQATRPSPGAGARPKSSEWGLPLQTQQQSGQDHEESSHQW